MIKARDTNTSTMWKLYFDGASRGNPGLASYGAVLYDDDIEVNYTRGTLGTATNNQAEYQALINGLQIAIDQIGDNSELNVYGDSSLVLKQSTGEWKCNNDHLRELLSKVKKLEQRFSKVTYNHVRRKFNKRADALANLALDENSTKSDA